MDPTPTSYIPVPHSQTNDQPSAYHIPLSPALPVLPRLRWLSVCWPIATHTKERGGVVVRLAERGGIGRRWYGGTRTSNAARWLDEADCSLPGGRSSCSPSSSHDTHTDRQRGAWVRACQGCHAAPFDHDASVMFCTHDRDSNTAASQIPGAPHTYICNAMSNPLDSSAWVRRTSRAFPGRGERGRQTESERERERGLRVDTASVSGSSHP